MGVAVLVLAVWACAARARGRAGLRGDALALGAHNVVDARRLRVRALVLVVRAATALAAGAALRLEVLGHVLARAAHGMRLARRDAMGVAVLVLAVWACAARARPGLAVSRDALAFPARGLRCARIGASSGLERIVGAGGAYTVRRGCDSGRLVFTSAAHGCVNRALTVRAARLLLGLPLGGSARGV